MFTFRFLFCWSMFLSGTVLLQAQDFETAYKAALDKEQYAEALQTAKQAEQAFRGKDDTAYVQSLFWQATVHSKQSNGEAEGERLNAALEHLRSMQPPNPDFLAKGLRKMGLYHQYITKNMDEAERFLGEAKDVQVARSGRESEDYAAALCDLAGLYRNAGRPSQADLVITECIALRRKLHGNKDPRLATALGLLGAILGYNTAEADFKRAEASFGEAAQIIAQSKGKQDPDYARYIGNLGGLYTYHQKFDKAEALMLESVRIYEQMYSPEHPEVLRTQYNLITFYFGIQQLDKVKTLLDKILPVLERQYGKFGHKYIQSHLYLARYYLDSKQPEPARKACMQGIAYCFEKESISEQIDEKWGAEFSEKEAVAPWDLTIFVYFLTIMNKEKYEIAKDVKALRENYYLDKAVMEQEAFRLRSFRSDTEKANVLAALDRAAISTVTHAGILYAAGDSSFKAGAFEAAERGKAVLIAGNLQASKAKRFGDLPDSLSLREQDLQKRYSKLEAQLLEAKDDSSRQVLRNQIADMGIEINLFKKEIEDKYPRYNALKYQHRTTRLQDVQAALPAKTLLLEYAAQSGGSFFCFAVSKDDLGFYSVNMQPDSLKACIADMRKALSDYAFIAGKPEEAYALYTAKAELLYERLLAEPLGKYPDIERLIIIPDGELGHLPFETFLTEKTTGIKPYKDLPYLLKRYKIGYNYSAGLWKEGIEQPARKNNGKVLAMAAEYNPQAELPAYRSPRHKELRAALEPIPATVKEVEGLQTLLSGAFLSGAKASEGDFKRQASEYQILHLAMHGLLDKKDPLLSSLAFTENGDSTEDNFLQAHEISAMQLQADLVVLSACETGYGRFQRGEGVLSLARAFLYAGVPSLVVSMWEVNDASTSDLMQAFYRNLKTGMDKAQALRQAKLDYLERAKGQAAHPAYWSAFVQMGDDRPLSMSGGMPWWWIAFGGGMIGFMALLASRRRKERRA